MFVLSDDIVPCAVINGKFPSMIDGIVPVPVPSIPDVSLETRRDEYKDQG